MNFQRAFYIQIEKTDIYQIGVKESTGDVTTGLARPLAAAIVFPPFAAITKALITSKRDQIDGNCEKSTK
jgi:hypothetical protein